MKSQETAVSAQAAVAAEPGAAVAPEKASRKKDATKRTRAPKAPKAGKGGKPKANKATRVAESPKTPGPAGEPKLPREGTAAAKVISMIQRKGGASIESIMKETGWAKHTIRGFMSTLMRRTGVEFTSTRRESDKARVYEAVRR